MRRSLQIPGAAVIVAAVLALASCIAPAERAPTPKPTPPASVADLGALGAPDCRPPSPSLGQEVQATGSGGVTGYGLMFGPEADALTAGADDMKMAVRMTGSGELGVRVIAPDGSERPLDWGPEIHGGSNFERPGSEWGIGFTFDAPGCWQIAFEREKGDRADFWFDVKA